MMKSVLLSCLVILAAVCSAEKSSPKVQVYSHGPAKFGKENVLICYVSEFHPPSLKIQLLKDGVEMDNCNQTDLTFARNWHFHLTRSRAFTPERGQSYSCRVIVGGNPLTYLWEPNM